MADVPRIAQALRDPDQGVRLLAQGVMWDIWSRSGDAEIDRMFAGGVQEMSEGRWDEAVTTFTRIITRKPDFAEGWNKRATVYYLMGDYKRSLADCDEVMKRNPFHYGALSGYGMIYVQLDMPARALEYYERALDVNPNLDGVKNAIEILRDQLIRQRRESI
jgi:tetratricopeptide (TPR) repeat protein